MKGADENPDIRQSLAGAVSINNRRISEGLGEAGMNKRNTNIGGVVSDTVLLGPQPALSCTAGEHVASMKGALHTLKSVKQTSGADTCDGECSINAPSHSNAFLLPPGDHVDSPFFVTCVTMSQSPCGKPATMSESTTCTLLSWSWRQCVISCLARPLRLPI